MSEAINPDKGRLSRTALIRLLRKLPEYETWKRAVFIRDRFQCQNCGKRNGRKPIIEAHHLKEFSVLIKENGISSVDEALQSPFLWEVSNGQTLCHSCHKLTESYPQNFCKTKGRKR